MKPSLLVHGMFGLGDNLHQRAVIRKLMETNSVWLETSWVSVYYDLIAQDLMVINKTTTLRTQAKNAIRERKDFHHGPVPQNIKQVYMRYSGPLVRQHGSVLNAMLNNLGLDCSDTDFRLPIPDAWYPPVDALIDRWKPQKPILIYRPLVLRREWFHSERNPDPLPYANLFSTIRDRFFVVSVADLVPNVEWIVSKPIVADAEFHHGELTFEKLAALFSRAALVYTSPGFAVPLAQAVSTPVACMFGGFENSSSFSSGARYSPYLGLDVDHPCYCFSHSHPCNKTIDLVKASAKLEAFIDDVTKYSEIISSYSSGDIQAEALS